MQHHLLTTTDNPYDPFDQWDEWWAWDFRHGYHTPGYLARIAVTSNELSEADYARAVELAIDEIVSMNLTGNYKKVTKDIPLPELSVDSS